MNPDLHVATNAATVAGEVLRAEFERGSVVRSEQGKDIKLAADVLAEQIILQQLRRATSYPIISEEAGADAGVDLRGRRWVVDPLDGTFNFSRRIPLCCVSIGLWDGDEPVLGVIHDFVTSRMYAGVVGEGAWIGGRPLQVSAVVAPERAALGTGFPAGRDFGRDSLADFVCQAQTYKKVRLIGSAALSLAYVAAGALDVYHEEDIYFWDVAAGLAIVKAAGGRYRVEHGATAWQMHVIATNGLLGEMYPVREATNAR